MALGVTLRAGTGAVKPRPPRRRSRPGCSHLVAPIACPQKADESAGGGQPGGLRH